MEWLLITQILTAILLVISESLGLAPVQVNGILHALLRLISEQVNKDETTNKSEL